MLTKQKGSIDKRFAENPFELHGSIRVADSGTHLEHADGTPFFFLADTCWSGPAISKEGEWLEYLKDRKHKGFTAIQFNMVSPWRCTSTDAEGRQSYKFKDGQFQVNIDYYIKRLDSRLKAINDIGLLAVPVLCWDHTAGDAGKELSEKNITTLIKFQIDRYKAAHALWILAGDSHYNRAESERWKRIGRTVFKDHPSLLVTTHPIGMSWPWDDWKNEQWLKVLGYQSGHGDSGDTLNWIHHGPHVEYATQKEPIRPIINLEPPYEGINGYHSGMPHSAYNVRRATYWSLMVTPMAGVTYGGHGVWSWHIKPNEAPAGFHGIANIWSEAINLPGANQMCHVRSLFESLPWTQLRPTQELLSQNSEDPGKYVTCMATPDKKIIIAYFPIGGQADINMASTPVNDAITWFNPSTGETNRGTLTPPDSQKDWILIIKN